jgi:hypothetical protein
MSIFTFLSSSSLPSISFPSILLWSFPLIISSSFRFLSIRSLLSSLRLFLFFHPFHISFLSLPQFLMQSTKPFCAYFACHTVDLISFTFVGHYQKNFKAEKPSQGSYTNRLFHVKFLYLLSISAFTDPRFLDVDLHWV